jgi:type I restriction enzyme M protein
MRHFATESGKSKGQFYTPAEVSRVIAKVVGVGSAKSANQTIHDPTCGSGSLLLKAHDEAKSATGIDSGRMTGHSEVMAALATGSI